MSVSVHLSLPLSMSVCMYLSTRLTASLSRSLTLFPQCLEGLTQEKVSKEKISNPVLSLSHKSSPHFCDLTSLSYPPISFLAPSPSSPVLWQWTTDGLVSSESSLWSLAFILSPRLSGRPPGTEYLEGGKGLLRRACEIVRHKRKTLGKNHPRPLLNEACHHVQRTKRALFYLLQCLQFDFFTCGFFRLLIKVVKGKRRCHSSATSNVKGSDFLVFPCYITLLTDSQEHTLP